MIRKTAILLAPDAGDGGGGEGDGFEAKVLGGVKKLTGQIESATTKITGLEGTLKTQGEDITKLKENANDTAVSVAELKKMRMQAFLGGTSRAGQVSEGLARALAGQFILLSAAQGRAEALSSNSAIRDALIASSRSMLGITGKAALSTAEIPLPTEYGGEIRELISQFGVIRKNMFPYPIGMGTARPARMGTRPAFASIAMSAAFDEKAPTITFASLESHKIGGIVRLPREIDEQSIVPMGQYLARYGAVEFARAEDLWGMLADGTATYESVKGIVQIAKDNNKTVTLGAGKTKPSDATLDDFRALRRAVNKAALNGKISAYYLDTTWETRLRNFNSKDDMWVYIRLPDGSATLDGYPIIWTDVMQSYGTVAAAATPIAVFGALSFWWMGEHGSPRIDTSDHVYFANDQLATRFIEEIDFDYAAVDATAALLTAAA